MHSGGRVPPTVLPYVHEELTTTPKPVATQRTGAARGGGLQAMRVVLPHRRPAPRAIHLQHALDLALHGRALLKGRLQAEPSHRGTQ